MALDFIIGAELLEARVRDEHSFASEEALIEFICDQQEFLVSKAEAELHRSRVMNEVK